MMALDSTAAFRSLLERTQSSDMSALGQLFTEYGDMVFRSALRLTGSRTDAEDVTQELFMRLPGAVRGFAGSSSNFPGWLRRVAADGFLRKRKIGRSNYYINIALNAALVSPPGGRNGLEPRTER